jgi:hypothetical protein
MAPLQQLAGILGLSVVSGINLYLSVLVVGLAERFHWASGLPPELGILGHPLVLVTAGLLFLVEFFADKIPFVTIVWDALHTVIRPVGGALLALGAAGRLAPVAQVVAFLAGGTIAFGAHGTKMGVRILAHTAPEPGTHGLLSMAEDVGVIGLLVLAYAHPYLALPLLGALVLLIALLLPLGFRVMDFLLTGLAGRAMSWVKQARRHEVPRWVELALLEADPSGSDWVARAFARKAKGVPRLKDGYLARIGNRWGFVHRGLFRAKVVLMDEGRREPARIDRGLFWNSVVFLRGGKVQEFLLPKDWSAGLSSLLTGPAEAGRSY